MAEILHFPGKDEVPRPPSGDLAGEALRTAASILVAAVGELLVDSDHHRRLSAIRCVEQRLKLTQCCLDVAKAVEQHLNEPLP